jgi:hypothetical protein
MYRSQWMASCIHFMSTLIKTLLGKEVPEGHVVHHKNGQRYNNTEANLAVVSSRVNAQAKVKDSGCSSKYKGVISTKSGKWGARITVGEGCQPGTYSDWKVADKITVVGLGTSLQRPEAGRQSIRPCRPGDPR